MIDWKRKLSSRKFWVAVAGFITAVLVACNLPELQIEQIAAIISAMGVLVAYILGESYADGQHAGEDTKEESGTDLIGFTVGEDDHE
jgi:hypothetical protein